VGFLLEAILQELKDNTKTQIISILPTLVNLVKFTLTLLQFMDTLMYIHISGLGLLALAHKEENTHTGVRFGHNFGSNLTQCVLTFGVLYVHMMDGYVP
jgi:hypothetical protein